MKTKFHIPPLASYALTLAIVIGGFILWSRDLSADPPMYFSGTGQSLITDPPQYIYHARNYFLFGDFTPFDYDKWTVFQHSITSAVALLVFSIAGISLTTANLVGVLLSFLGLLLLLLGLIRYHRPWVVFAVALCYVLNLTLLTHGRLSLLENGLIFLSCATFLAYCYWGTRTWGAVLCGALVAAAMLTGKLFGFMLLPALLTAYFLQGKDRRWPMIGLTIVGFAAAFVGLVLLLHGTRIGAAIGYVGEQSYGLHGMPEGLSSPWAFFEKLIPYGFRNRLYFLNPDVGIFLIAGGLWLVYFLGRNPAIGRLSRSTVFITLWLAFGIIGLAPLTYSPIRYALLFLPALVSFAFVLADDILRLKPDRNFAAGRTVWIISILVCWIAAFHITTSIFYLNVPEYPVRLITWISAVIGIVMAWLIVTLMKTERLRFNSRIVSGIVVAIIAFSVVENSSRIYRNHFAEHNFNIKEANAELQAVLGPTAIVSGPYAPVLTTGNRIGTFIHMFGVASLDATLFNRYPVTHLLCDVSNWEIATRDYPQLRDLPQIASFWICDYEVRLYNVSRAFSNPVANAYKPTEYELAMQYYHWRQIDTSLAQAASFYRAHPETKSGAYLLAELYVRNHRFEEAFPYLKSVADRFPTDFYAQLTFGRLLQMMANTKQDMSLFNLSQTYYSRASMVNPYRGDMLNQIWEQTNRMTANPQQAPPAGNP